MKKLLNYRGMKTSLVLLALGLVSLIIQNIFYGSRLDENNVIQDSIFLPMGMILFILGCVVFIISLTWGLLNKSK